MNAKEFEMPQRTIFLGGGTAGRSRREQPWMVLMAEKKIEWLHQILISPSFIDLA